MAMAKVIVWATAVFFLLYGAVFVVWPIGFSLLVTQSAPQSISGLVDFRATYGGMSIAVGVILAITTTSPLLTRFGVLAVAITMLAMAIGRSIGIAVDGLPNTLMYVYLMAELVTAGVAGYAWSVLSKIELSE